ncbi:MAG: potassium channel family protein [Solirubrobacterales bacterium]
MYAIIVGGGKVGLNLARELMQKGNEVTLIEASRRRYTILEPQLEHVVHLGDGTELWVLERAGIERADMVIAVTGDDEDNIIISQVAREKYGRDKIIARCNNIRNMEHFDLLGIKPVVSATDLILRLIEHEVPQYGLVHLLKLQAEDLEIIEVEVSVGSHASGKRVEEIDLPEGSLLIAILREGSGFVPRGDTVIESGDEVLLVLNPGIEEGITKLFTAPEESFA